MMLRSDAMKQWRARAHLYFTIQLEYHGLRRGERRMHAVHCVRRAALCRHRVQKRAVAAVAHHADG